MTTNPVDVNESESTAEAFHTMQLQNNVAEWVFDGEKSYTTSSCDGLGCVTLPANLPRGVRGGSWIDGPFRTFDRSFAAATARSLYIGFRCARNSP
jgi:formylglycine-generating enzyme required for sulfatase activity